jgi:erythromycin esterase-like protein
MRLEGWVRTIQDLARRLAESLGADSYSIGISMPVGVSFDLSFNT